MFNTNYNIKQEKPIEVSQELKTEQTGYRSTKEMVESLILSGEKLYEYRHGLLDNTDEEHDESQDPAVVYEQDPVELTEAVEQRYMRFRGEKKEGTDEKDVQILQEGQEDVPEPSVQDKKDE
jgi:hypothetical protein